MTQNIGKVDKVIRLLLGIAIVAWGFYAHSWWGLIGIVPLATASLGYCPLYSPFQINTK